MDIQYVLMETMSVDGCCGSVTFSLKIAILSFAFHIYDC